MKYFTKSSDFSSRLYNGEDLSLTIGLSLQTISKQNPAGGS